MNNDDVVHSGTGRLDAGDFDAGVFDAASARRLWQLAELERALLASLAQNPGSAAILRELALALERMAAPGTLAAILVVDESTPGTLRHGAAPSLPAAYVAQIDGQALASDAGSCETPACWRSPLIVHDIASDPRAEQQRGAALAAGLRASWSAPVLATTGELLGSVAFFHREPRSPEAIDRITLDGATRLVRVVLERERADRMSRRSAQRERALCGVASVLASEESVPAAMEQLLAALGDALAWQAGLVWLHDGTGSPHRAAAWSTDAARFGAFLAEASRQPGLPLSASASAASAGVRHGLCIPIQAGDDVIGSVELFTGAELVIDAELESALCSVGLQVGQFCRRARAQADRQGLIAELEETLRFSELFASILAHDLRNPLNTLSMGTQLLLRDAVPGVASILQRMQSSAGRMSRMIEQLLDVTRSREGCGLALDRDAIQLGELASAAVNELAIAFPHTRIELHVEGDTAGHWDRDRLAQVFSNLIGNAIEHGERDGSVRVRVVGLDAERVALETHNLGRIAPEALATLFDPFKPSLPARRRSRGLGLGLYITHLIVTAHGGSIDVCSDAEGTRFLVQLPRALDVPAPDRISVPPASGVRPRGADLPPAQSDVAGNSKRSVPVSSVVDELSDSERGKCALTASTTVPGCAVSSVASIS